MTAPGAFRMTADMRRVVDEQRLGFVATVGPDGTPNLSPKGTTSVWDDRHLVFADIRSPRTVRNIASNPWVEVNVVDQVSRRGYRFKGTARVLTGDEHDAGVRFFSTGERAVHGARERIEHVVLIEVVSAAPVTSPAYDTGATEESLRARWRAYFEGLWDAR